ncbi:hypothetical protein EJV47_21115 [Hymenobacter gummosus]|uniref:Lipoprotein n=1 Tax=Hymenobacter gummosus TaxID=1776032 RepID=A0A431TYP7_9BACT|nr:hypothetical protein [Hymenobacter gummosus]RTQ46874.1 hypothetical protein EJV47_21115 [Hymenobacter gummosus]
MPQFLRSALLLPLSALLLLGCKKEEEAPVEPVVPLAVGNSWTYKVTNYAPWGPATDSLTFTRSVVKDTIISKGQWFITNDRLIVRNDADGYVIYMRGSKESNILYSRTRNNIMYGYDYPNYRLWVQSLKNETLEPVPQSAAGYSAYRYDISYQYEFTGVSTPSVQKRQAYVTPGVGLVREVRYYRDQPTQLQQRTELLSYHLH